MRSFRVLAGVTTASLTVVLAAPSGATPAPDIPVFQIQEIPSTTAAPTLDPQAVPESPVEKPPGQSFEVDQIPVSPAPVPAEGERSQRAAVPDVPDMQVQVGQSFRYHITAPADTYVAVVSGLPAGLVFHPLSSEIIGTPADSPAGEYIVGITTYNRRGEVGNGSFVMKLLRDDASSSLLQELLTSPQRGVEKVKELIDRVLGTKLATNAEQAKGAETQP